MATLSDGTDAERDAFPCCSSCTQGKGFRAQLAANGLHESASVSRLLFTSFPGASTDVGYCGRPRISSQFPTLCWSPGALTGVPICAALA